jgi:hypothetical protein
MCWYRHDERFHFADGLKREIVDSLATESSIRYFWRFYTISRAVSASVKRSDSWWQS